LNGRRKDARSDRCQMQGKGKASMPNFDFTAAGFLVLDILGRYADSMPPEGGAHFIEQIDMTVAGTAGGTAVACAILGLRGRIAARVGKDDMGDYLIRKMRSFGLETDLVQIDESEQTSCSLLPIRSNGARSAFFVPGTTRTFTMSDREIDAALDARVVHLGGTGLLDAFDGERSTELLKRAKAVGRTTVFDLILANEETLEKVMPLLPFIDYFVPSIDEAAEMAGSREPEKVAEWFKNQGVKNAILTLEGEGAFISSEAGHSFRIPAHEIDVVDTTGCGDSFTAGIIAGLSKGWDIEKTAKFANAVAANVALGLGSVGKLKSFDSAMQAMETWPLRS